MKKVKYLVLLLPLVLAGCAGGGGGFDMVAFTKNPIVMILIGIIVLWVAFKSSAKH